MCLGVTQYVTGSCEGLFCKNTVCLSFVFSKTALELIWKMLHEHTGLDAEGRASSQVTPVAQGRGGKLDLTPWQQEERGGRKVQRQNEQLLMVDKEEEEW